MDVNGQMYSGDAKIADLVEKHLETKEKIKMKGGRLEHGVQIMSISS
jgi:hypothetical protein